MAKKYNFSFNLLPPKTSKEIEKEEKRSSALLYTTGMLFGVTFFWVLINLFGTLFISRSKDYWTDQKHEREKQVASYNLYKAGNGELVIKTNILEPVVEKHVDPDLVFELIDNVIKENAPEAEILSYGRNPLGNFQVEARSSGVETSSNLVKIFREKEEFEDARLDNVKLTSNNEYQFILDLSFSVEGGA